MFLRIFLLVSIPLVLCYKIEVGKQFDAAQYSNQGEKGSKGYSSLEHAEKGAKGHHDRENHQKEYAEKAGHKNGHQHKDGYYGDHHQGHKGRQGYHFVDHGKYAKGHKTKGHHNVHKLDEFKKRKDFFDENNDQWFEEKHAGFEATKGAAKGKHLKGGHFNKGYDQGHYGKTGFVEGGSHHFSDQGHDKAQGHKDHFANHEQFAKKAAEDGFKNFGFSHSQKSLV